MELVGIFLKKNEVSSFSLDYKPKYLGIVRDYSY